MELRQSTAVSIPFGPFLDETDGKTPETTLTITQPDIRLKKNGNAWIQKNAAQTLTHEENGNYEIDLDTTDTNTLGNLRIHVHESGALPVWKDYAVVTANYWDSKYGSAVREANVIQVSGDTTAADNLEASLDGTGYGTLAQGGSASTITLDTGASAVDDFYNGLLVVIVSGPGGGQARLVSDYVGATKVATVSSNWVTNPTSSSVFALLPWTPASSGPTAVQIADEVQTRGLALSVAERNAVADAHLDRADAIESGVTPRGAIRLIGASTVGKASGAASTPVVYRNMVQDSKNRITATVDANGNRTAITTDMT